MTRDGLVEHNVTTGEEVRVSQRGQDFRLRADKAPERDLSAERQAGSFRPAPSVRETISGHSGRSYQAPPPRTDTPAPEIPRPSGEAPAQDAPGAFPVSEASSPEPARPADQPLRQEARPNEAPDAPRQKQHGTAYHNRFAEDPARPDQAAARDSPAPEDTRLAERLSRREAPEPPPAPASARDTPDAGGRRVLSERPGRLRFDDAPAASASAKNRQRGTQYQRRFAADTAEKTGTGDSASAGSLAPEASVPNGNRPVTSPPTDTGGKPDGGRAPDAPVPKSPGSKLQFTPDEKPPASAPPASKKLQKARDKAGKSAEKLDAARKKLPTTRRARMEKTFDPDTGKMKRRLHFEEEVKSRRAHVKGPLPLRPVKVGANAAIGYAHKKIYQVERENVGVEAAHKAELAVEGAARWAWRRHKTKPYRRVSKLQRKTAKANIKLAYRQALEDNPKLKSNLLSRMMQKHKIKRQYAKAAREAKRAGGVLRSAGSVVVKTARAVAGVVARHPMVFGVLALLLLVMMMIMGMFSSCSNMAMGGFSSVLASSYLAEDADINAAETIYTQWENGLREDIKNAETDHPGFDEYRYSLDEIGHDPRALMSYLTAVYRNFRYADVYDVLRELFEEQYTLEFVEEVEVRYADPYDSDDDGDREPYDYNILNINLTSKPFPEVIAPRLDAEQQELHDQIMESGGNRQYAMSPFAFDWTPYISSYFGYRIHPITGESDFHTGIDIAVGAGTSILAAHDGVVTSVVYGSTGYGYQVMVAGEDGLSTRYAHCDAILVSAGQEVKAGDVIARVGSTGDSTGPHLHFEVIKDGAYLNPIYFAQTKESA